MHNVDEFRKKFGFVCMYFDSQGIVVKCTAGHLSPSQPRSQCLSSMNLVKFHSRSQGLLSLLPLVPSLQRLRGPGDSGDENGKVPVHTEALARKTKQKLCVHAIETVSSVGRVPDYRAGGRGFEPRPDHHSGSLK